MTSLDCKSVQTFMREGYLGRWDQAAKMFGLSVQGAKTQHMALRMAAAMFGLPDGSEAYPASAIKSDIRMPTDHLREACDIAGITVKQACSTSRLKPLTVPRQHVMAILYDRGINKSKIGRYLNRDHTTVMHGIRKHKERAGMPA